MMLLLCCVLLPLTALAQTRYPLYAIDSVASTSMDANDTAVIASNFVFIQGVYSSAVLQALTSAGSVHPVWYINSDTSSVSSVFATNNASWVLSASYYTYATLNSAISPSQTELQVTTLPLRTAFTDDMATNYRLVARLGNELLLVTQASTNTTITVERGYLGTEPQAYASNTTLFSPVYNAENFPHQGNALTYVLDPRQPYSVSRLVNHTVQALAAGYSGSWLDCLSNHQFDSVDVGGIKLTGKLDQWIWDFHLQKPYNTSTLMKAQADRLNQLNTEILHAEGLYPKIVANNMATCFQNPVGSCRPLLDPNTHGLVRPLDGYSMEEFVAQETNNDPYKAGCGTDLNISLLPAEVWYGRVNTLIEAGRSNLSALPMIAQAGCKSVKLEMVDDAVRDYYETFAYASFLLAVSEAHPTALKLGLPAWYRKYPNTSREVRYARVHPRYALALGKPLEQPTNVSDLRVSSQSYARVFEHAIAVVNPSLLADRVTLNGSYVDPFKGSGTPIQVLSLPPQTAALLMMAAFFDGCGS
eukprot:m.28213 g.28213  ORF g.28213 m.28213 type:complete len:530 (+) comp11814_c0_seq1:30-1619(+)